MNALRTRKVIVTLFAGFALIQLVPYGRDHSNPPVVQQPEWDSPATHDLAERACFDCHSHETKWPWYSHVAPISWLTTRDVEEGRHHLNFSRWDVQRPHAVDEMGEEIEEGEMPLWIYLPLHPEARLSDAESKRLVKGLRETAEASPPGGGERGGGADRD